mgnify:CR=1 FL=1
MHLGINITLAQFTKVISGLFSPLTDNYTIDSGVNQEVASCFVINSDVCLTISSNACLEIK